MNKTPRRAPPPRFTIVQQRPDRRPLIAVVLGLAWLASIVGVWIGASRVAAPRLPAMTAELDAARDELRRWRSQAEQLAQREATLARSDQISRGRLHFTVEGVRDGKLATVGWDELHQRSDVPPQDYSFRYFQQLKGSVMLPAGFTPQRVRVSLDGGDVAVEQTLGWQIGTT